MKIVKDCWGSLAAFECQYGAHIFDGITLKIYVNHWLTVFGELGNLFTRKNAEGYVGHCLLVFHGVKDFDFSVRTYEDTKGGVVWHAPISQHLIGRNHGETMSFALEGSLQGFPSSLSYTINANKFELHVLDESEPAKQQ
jgi:hypothetical protein